VLEIKGCAVMWHGPCLDPTVLHGPEEQKNRRRAKDGQASSWVGCPPGDRTGKKLRNKTERKNKTGCRARDKKQNPEKQEQRQLSNPPGPA
jgi:hypothetical protein